MSTNSMGEEDRQGDQELASFTDALLTGEVAEGSARPALADVVETLARTITPQSPPEALRQQLRERTATEWAKQPRRPGWSLASLLGRPAQRWVWAAATLVVALAIAVVLFTPAGTAGLSATAAGGPATTVVVAALVLIGLVALGVWLITRR
jgi:hypothetical protein